MARRVTAIWGNKENGDGDQVYYLEYAGVYELADGRRERRGYLLRDVGEDRFERSEEQFALRGENRLCDLALRPQRDQQRQRLSSERRVFTIPLARRAEHFERLRQSIAAAQE